MVKSSKVKAPEWALDNANVSVRVKPRRPYTPYNLFYLLERALLVQGPPTSSDLSSRFSNDINPEDKFELPARYRGKISLSPQWYDPNRKEKRKHRKTHGKISFQELTEVISTNWATIDEETKGFCTTLSEIGRKNYRDNMSRFIASKKILELKEEKSIMIAAREEKLKTVGTPPRAKAIQVAKPIVTPERTLPKTYGRSVPGPHDTAATPPYGQHHNRAPVYYSSSPFYGHPSIPAPPPPMSFQMTQPYYHMITRMPPGPPPPMPSSSPSHRHCEYQPLRNPNQYNPFRTAAASAYADEYNYFNAHMEHQPAPYGSATAGHHWRHHGVRGEAIHYEPRGSQTFKTGDEDHTELNSSLSNVYNEESNTKETKYKAPREHDHDDSCRLSRKSATQNDAMKIRSFMSFDSIKSDFDLCIESSLEDSRQQQAGFADQTNVLLEDDESILGLLREDLHPIDNKKGISFQLSWKQDRG